MKSTLLIWTVALIGLASGAAHGQENKTIQGLLAKIYAWELVEGRLVLKVLAKGRPDFFGEASNLGLGVTYSWRSGSGSSSSGRGGEQIHFSERAFSCHSKKRDLRFSVLTGHRFSSILLSCSGDRLLVFQQSTLARLVIFDGPKSTVATGKDYLDLVSRNPAACRTMEKLLGQYLLEPPIHPLQRKVIDLALRGFEPISDEHAKQWQAKIALLGNKTFKIRTAATQNLKKQLHSGDPRLYRYLEMSLKET